MRKLLLIIIFVAAGITNATAQRNTPQEPQSNSSSVVNKMVKTDTATVTKNQITIKGQLVPYTATAGSIPVFDEDGKAIAGVFIRIMNVQI